VRNDASIEGRRRGKEILMARIKPKEFIDKVITSEVKTAFWVSWLVFVFVVGFTYIFFKYKGDFLRSVFVEAHGMLFDLFVIATFILWLNKKAEKRRNIQRWQEEIDDFRGWDEKEATFRIVGNIKRLNRNGITEISLYDCFLRGANLEMANLREAVLTRANLKEASLAEVNLWEADLSRANLSGANLMAASLVEADLTGASLAEANLWKADLSGADLRRAELERADFGEANLRGAKLTIEQLSKVKTLFQTILDPELEKEVKQKYPHLLEMPEFPKEEK